MDKFKGNRLISFIIPMYNTEKYIEKCLKSLEKQSCWDFEIIIINDGSTDNSLKVTNEFLKVTKLDYKVITVDNAGVSSARNLGIREAKGEYILFLDSDDYINFSLVEKISNIVKDKKYDMVFFGFDQVDEDGNLVWTYKDSFKYIENIIEGKQALKKMLKSEIWICSSNVVYNRNFLVNNRMKYNTNSCNGEDQAFTLKNLFNCKEIFNIKEVLFHYVKRESSISNSNSLSRLTVIEAFYDLYKFLDENGADDSIKNYIETYKFPVELMDNIMNICKRSESDDVVNSLNSPKIDEVLKKFKLKSFNSFELKMYVKVKIFLLNKKLFYKLIK